MNSFIVVRIGRVCLWCLGWNLQLELMNTGPGPGHDLDGRSLQPSELLSCPALPTYCPLSLPSPGTLESVTRVLCVQLAHLCVIYLAVRLPLLTGLM